MTKYEGVFIDFGDINRNGYYVLLDNQIVSPRYKTLKEANDRAYLLLRGWAEKINA